MSSSDYLYFISDIINNLSFVEIKQEIIHFFKKKIKIYEHKYQLSIK